MTVSELFKEYVARRDAYDRHYHYATRNPDRQEQFQSEARLLRASLDNVLKVILDCDTTIDTNALERRPDVGR